MIFSSTGKKDPNGGKDPMNKEELKPRINENKIRKERNVIPRQI